MSRTVAALYDSRVEAERARARLISEIRAKSPRIIGRDTAAALDGMNLTRADAEAYRDGVRRGSHLLVAEVPSSAPAERIIELLEQSTGASSDDEPANRWGAEQGIEVKLSGDREESEAEEDRQSAPEPEPEPAIAAAPEGEPEPPPMRGPEAAATTRPAEEPRPGDGERELRTGRRELVRGGARVHSFTREAPVEEQVSLNEEVVEVERRACERQLSDGEIEAGGLFKDRVFEIAEMRDEPVVTKTAVVREEIIVTKRVKQRTETIRDTVRRTEVELGDMDASDADAPTFFGS